MQKVLSRPPGPGVALAGVTTNPAGLNKRKNYLLIKCFRIMKLVMLLLTIACLQSSAKGYSQAVTLSVKNETLANVFEQIEKQTGYLFIYAKEELAKASPVTIELKNVSLRTALDKCLLDQPLSYTIEDNHVVLYKKEEQKIKTAFHEVTGRVINQQGDPVAGVTVSIKGSQKISITDKEGAFGFADIEPQAVLIISGAEIETQEIKINKRNFINVSVIAKVNELDKVLVMAYGETTKRLSTGNISKITREEIARQPVSNPLAALQGSVPGLIVTQNNGVPGSSFKIQIRGRNSIAQGSNPLFIIDGVPFAAGNGLLNQIQSAMGIPFDNSSRAGGLSPFNLINPDDIESIEILKDADATAIYGSRGANGVILISTRKGKEGKITSTININSGTSKITFKTPFLNTQQYVDMRKEGFANDDIIPNPTPGTAGYAPDILIWPTNRYTDLQKLLIGGAARFTEAQTSVSGGNQTTQFLMGGSYRHQSTVYPGDFSDNQGSFHLNLNHASANKKFNLFFTGNYSTDRNNLLSTDLAAYMYLPPNIPALFDSLGQLNWEEGGEYFNNPLSSTLQKYSVKSENLLSNLQLNYRLFTALNLKISVGYNSIRSDETSIIPLTSIDPRTGAQASAGFANGNSSSWTIEPQLEYIKKVSHLSLKLLLGSTWQETDKRNSSVSGENFTSDALLGSVNAAGKIAASNNQVLYRYNAFFGRLHLNWEDKYLLTLSGRRDGSSRFGTDRQFANFGAAGISWILSNESFLQKKLSVLSFAKLRSSYGTTGNDQIGDYQFLDAWSATNSSYQGTPGIYPVRLNNPDYSWEINRKFEAAVELGFIKDKILLTAAFYKNTSSNQLIGYPLPIQTGFNTVNRNFDALVENKGWEFTLTTKNITTEKFKWETAINLTAPTNKLISFPGLATSSYAYIYKEGYPLSLLQGYHYLGIDPQTGVHTFEDLDKDGALSFPNDFVVVGNLDPRIYGGIMNTLKYKNVELNLLLEFRKQTGRNYLYNQLSFLPGRPFNQPNLVLDRWQNPGDISNVQKFTAAYGAAYIASTYLASSGALYSDASYIRGKNLAIAYVFNQLSKFKIERLKAYILAQNLFTITNYKGADPETQNLYALPPLRTIIVGIQANF